MANDYADDARKLPPPITFYPTAMAAVRKTRVAHEVSPSHAEQVRSVQLVMEQIKSSALTVPMVPNTLAQQDFKPALIVDSVAFADNWGDAR